MKRYPVIVLLLILSLLDAGAKKMKEKKTPVAGKIIFSNQPITSGTTGKNNFTSHDYIYARLELSSSNIKDAFKVKEVKDRFAYVECDIFFYNMKGEEVGNYDDNYILLKDDDKSASSLNFDVYPEPSKATTIYSILDDFSAGYGFSPMHALILNSRIPEGDYKVKIRIYTKVEDGWGRRLDEDKWPILEDEFEYKFMESDIPKVKSDYDKIIDEIKENAFRYDKLPSIFSNSATITDPKATNAKILAIVKRDLPQRTILKLAIEKTGTLWSIAKDDYNLPKWRYFYPAVWVAYKMEGKCYVGSVTLRQTYTGGGTWGPLEVGFTSASSQQDKGIDCIKVK